MAYIGQQPFQEFASVPTKDSFTGDGSTTTFDLANDVVRGGENALEVFVNNVRQEPGSGKSFTLGVDGSNNYRRITFSAAPANSAVIYVINDKTNLSAIAPVNTDFNGAELVLDADADTTLHADTDDEIDIRIGGNDVIMLKQSSGDGIITIPTDAKDLQFTQFDGYKVLEINDAGFVGVGGNSNAAGEIRIFEDTDNGSNYSGFKAAASTTSSVAYTLPAADGSSGTHLTTDGSGALSWTASVSLANDSNNRVITGTGSGLNGEANLTFDGSTLAVTGALTASGAITGSSTVQGTTITATTAFVPDASDGAALGTTALEFSDLFLADASTIQFGADQDVTLTHTADTGLTLNSTMKLMFNDASQFIQGTSATVLSIGATDEIDLTATAVDLNGTLNVSGVATFQAAPVFPDGSIAVADLDIDGATDINADIVDADLFIIDDGAGGTNRKTTASRIKTYIGGGTQWQAVKTANYTAAAGQGVFANTTSSAFTVTLPAGTLGDEVTIVDYAGTFDSNALTVAADGSEKIFGSTDDLTVSTERAAFTLVFTDSTQGWLLKSK